MVLAAVTGVAIGVMVVTVINSQKYFAGINEQSNGSSQASHPLSYTVDPIGSIARLVVPPLDHHMNILLMGVDSNGRNTDRFVGTRSDTMIIVGVDAQTKKVGLVSIPRDSRVTLANGRGEDKINAAHAYGGPDLAVATVQSTFNVPIDRYVVVDVQGLKRLLEIIGPVEILVEKKMYYQDNTAGLHIALKPGLQTLDATTAEEYVRFRHDAKGDLGRIDRQQWFLRQVYKKLDDPQIITKLPDLFNAANEYVVTNLSVPEMAQLAAFGRDVQPSSIQTAMIPGKVASINGGSFWLPDVESASIVFNRLLNTPASSSLTTDRLASNPTSNLDTAYAADGRFGDPDPSTYSSSYSQGYLDPSTQTPQTPAQKAPETGPLTVLIRYPKGAEQAAKNLEMLANSSGLKVKYRYRADLSDCQHEQIIENTARVDDSAVDNLRHQITCLAQWPAVINLDSQAASDLTFVVSPQTYVEAANLPNSTSSSTKQ
jgi:LCP family protein required for cell wall assembly